MNRIAAFVLVAASLAVPTLAHAESGAPAKEERRGAETPKESWVRILPLTTNVLFPKAAPSMSPAFGVHFDAKALGPTHAPTTPQLATDLPGIPLVVFKF